MTKAKRQPDPNEDAARVLREATAAGADALPADLEAAWSAWSRAIKATDQRTMTLLRAAFEAGWDASRATPPRSTARR